MVDGLGRVGGGDVRVREQHRESIVVRVVGVGIAVRAVSRLGIAVKPNVIGGECWVTRTEGRCGEDGEMEEHGEEGSHKTLQIMKVQDECKAIRIAYLM